MADIKILENIGPEHSAARSLDSPDPSLPSIKFKQQNAGPVQPEDHDQIDGPSSPGVNTQTDGPCNPGDIWSDGVVESEMLPSTADFLKAMSTTPSDISLRALF